MARNARLSADEQAVAGETDGNVRNPRLEGSEAETPNDTLMTIGEVAREFGLTLRALRFYEAKRLVAPQRHRGVRLYCRSDRNRIALILTGKRLGFTLAEIKELVGKPDGNRLHLNREQCLSQIRLLERQKRGIEMAIAELRLIYTSFYKRLLEDGDSRSLRSR